MTSSAALVIGIGNDARRDDGVGLAVVRRLRAAGDASIRCTECAGDAVTLLDLWRGSPHVILVDAMRSGAVPGTVQRFSTAGDSPPPCTALHSTHAMGIFDALQLAAALDEAPEHVVIYGVEVEDVGYGETLTPAVANAVEPLVRRIIVDVMTLFVSGT